jgi:hypothetical protein
MLALKRFLYIAIGLKTSPTDSMLNAREPWLTFYDTKLRLKKCDTDQNNPIHLTEKKFQLNTNQCFSPEMAGETCFLLML